MTWEYIFTISRDVTFTLPGLETLPTSFLARSRSIRCSARSFPSVMRSAAGAFILLLAFSPGPGAGNGKRGDGITLELDHDLGRRADERHILKVDVEEVGRWVDVPEAPVGVEGIAGCIELEPAGEHRLDDLAVSDVLFCLAHGIDEVLFHPERRT